MRIISALLQEYGIHFRIAVTIIAWKPPVSSISFRKTLILFSHSILQSLMQLSVHQFYISTTCFGHIGLSSGIKDCKIECEKCLNATGC
jgi:hypothetical protein